MDQAPRSPPPGPVGTVDPFGGCFPPRRESFTVPNDGSRTSVVRIGGTEQDHPWGWVLNVDVIVGTGMVLGGRFICRDVWKGSPGATGAELAGVAYTDFALSLGGRIHVPWPLIDFTVRDLAAGGGPAQTSIVRFNARPVREGMAPGAGTILYGRELETALVASGTASVTIPAGVTHYRFFAQPTGGIVYDSISITEQTVFNGTTRDWGAYSVTPDEALINGEAGAMGWQLAPPSAEDGSGSGRRLQVVNNDGANGIGFVVLWKYDMGALL